jgi:hypothetical protein
MSNVEWRREREDSTFPHNSTTRSAQKISPEEKKQNKLINGARKLLAF